MKTLLVSAALACFAPALVADELRREWIDPNAKLVVHLDWEGLQRTQLWQEVLKSNEGDFEIDDLEEFKQEFGLELEKDLRSVTMYSLSLDQDSSDDAVIVLSTTAALDEALSRVAAKPEYRSLVHEGLELHAFGEGEDSMLGYVHSLPQGRVLVLSASAERVANAARIVRGETLSHARAEIPKLDLTPGPGSFLFVAAKELSGLDGFEPASRIFGMTQGLRIDVGEHQGSLVAHLSAATAAPEDATNVADVLRGLKAMANLAASEHGELVEFAQAITINTRGAEVLLDFEFDIVNLLENVKAMDEGF